MKIKYILALVGVAITCLIISFAINISFFWLCTAAVENFGMIIPAATLSVLYTVLVVLRVLKS
jgi:hypothetical protein